MLISTRAAGKHVAYSRAIMGQANMVLERRREAYLTAMGAEWSWLAPSPEDCVQFGRGTARRDGRANLLQVVLQLSEQRGVVTFTFSAYEAP
jgi:hypothetical protein